MRSKKYYNDLAIHNVIHNSTNHVLFCLYLMTWDSAGIYQFILVIFKDFMELFIGFFSLNVTITNEDKFLVYVYMYYRGLQVHYHLSERIFNIQVLHIQNTVIIYFQGNRRFAEL